MFTPQPIGFVSSPFKNTREIPKGLGAKHTEKGALKILPEFELGLTDIEGFCHLIVIWEFDLSRAVEFPDDDEMRKSLDVSQYQLEFGQDLERTLFRMLRAQSFRNLPSVFERTAHKSNGLRRKHDAGLCLSRLRELLELFNHTSPPGPGFAASLRFLVKSALRYFHVRARR